MSQAVLSPLPHPVSAAEVLPDVPVFHQKTSREDIAQSVYFNPLENNSEKIVKQWLGTIIKPEKNQWTELNHAHWKKGGVLVVPPHTDLGVITLTHTPQAKTSVFLPRLLVVVQQGGKLVLLDEYSGEHSPDYAVPVIEIAALENSEIHYIHLQKWNYQTQHYVYSRIHLQKNAFATATTCILGGGKTNAQIEVSLQGEGSRANLFGVVYGTKEQNIEHFTLQEHLAPHTESDLLIKTALRDKAQSYFNGLIWIEKGASKTSAYQQNRNLLLSSAAKAETTPKLEILDNDVRCTHGASVGPVDEEQIFYLESRGIPRNEAEALIVEGFFQDLLDRIPAQTLKEDLSQEILAALAGTAENSKETHERP
jgi:Fe-S cluster assembly protein SufD